MVSTTTADKKLPNPLVVERVARVVGLVFGGIFAGLLVTVLVLELSLRRYDASIYTQVRHAELIHLDTLATVTLLPTVAATIVLVYAGLKRGASALGFTAAALALLAVAFVVSIVVNLPINADQLDWSVAHPPTDWADDRDRWQVAHAVRTVAAVLAYVCLVVASEKGRRSTATSGASTAKDPRKVGASV